MGQQTRASPLCLLTCFPYRQMEGCDAPRRKTIDVEELPISMSTSGTWATSDPDSCPVSRCLIHMYTELLLQLRNILIIQLNFTHKMGFLSFHYIQNQNCSSKALSQSPVLLCFLNFYYRDHCCYNAVCDLGPQRSSASPRHHVYLF